ncbi:MAG: TetR/AcrR family transcriptional regulator [Clostridia bacterium]|nr:TetR/AcrR family transcriptional regulator [Clostridia bacterium]
MNKTKRKLFKTAIKLFAEKGYENTGIEEITAVAGFAKGALYYHFDTKEDLFDLMLEEGSKLLNNSIDLKFRHCNNALERIKAILMIEIKTIITYEDFITVVINNTLGETSRTKKCQKAVNNYVYRIEEVVKEGIEEGLFLDDRDPEAIAFGIFGVTFSSLLYRLKQDRNVSAEKIYDGFVATVVKGVTK